ncbi:hypothetical protein D9M70_406210 [compost metagenome]
MPQTQRYGVTELTPPYSGFASSGAMKVYMPRLAMAANSDTRRMVITLPSARIASFCPSVLAAPAGNSGSFSARPARAMKPSRVISQSAACQPICSARSRLNGTPSTTPLAMPPMMVAMALPWRSVVETAADAPIPMAR